jgi:hypothetical protein
MAARCRWCDRFLDPAAPAPDRGLCPACLRVLRQAAAGQPPPVPKAGRRKKRHPRP